MVNRSDTTELVGEEGKTLKGAAARELRNTMETRGLSARQAMCEIKSGQGDMEMPELPELRSEEDTAPEEIYTFSDGAVQNPTIQDVALGGCGIGIPDQTEAELQERMRGNTRFVECTSTRGGMAMFFHFVDHGTAPHERRQED